MKNKTVWQLVALVSYFVGVVSNFAGWFTRSWLLILLPFPCWALSIWCVLARPVKKLATPHPQSNTKQDAE